MDDFLETTEEAFDLIPEEVQDYIYSSGFNNSLDALCSEVGVDVQKKDLLRGTIFSFIAQIDDQEELVNRINSTTDDPIKRQKINSWIDVNVSQKIFSLINDAYALEGATDDDTATGDNGITPVVAPAPVTLSSLADRLKQASISNTSKRDYSFDIGKKPSSPENPSTEPTPSSKPAIDPYHEAIDNE